MLGILVGMIAAIVAGRWLASLVYGVRAFDPPVLITVVLVSVATTLTATYLAAHRALEIEPVEAMRSI
jgi:putative ABC transport system permease protein